MQNKSNVASFFGYLFAVAVATFGIVYFLNYTNKTAEVVPTQKDVVAETAPISENTTATNKPMQNDATELKIEDLVVGTGDEATTGKAVTVNYTGKLTDGSVFDSSLKEGRTPFEFNLGAGEVIQGWDQGVAGMKVGGKRRLTVPASLGYGPNGYPPVIPGNATLIFDVELLEVK